MFAPMTIGIALITLMMSAPTIVTTMLVVVEEDWSKTVAKIPIVSPAEGLSTEVSRFLQHLTGTSQLLDVRLPPSGRGGEVRGLLAVHRSGRFHGLLGRAAVGLKAEMLPPSTRASLQYRVVALRLLERGHHAVLAVGGRRQG